MTEVYHRPAGQLLQPERDSPEAIDELKCEIGSRVFAAQYQQNPTPPDGNMIKAAWLGRYDAAPPFWVTFGPTRWFGCSPESSVLGGRR
jgi:hypothetical protein